MYGCDAMSKKPSQQPITTQVGILVGMVLIVYGLVRLCEHFLGAMWWGVFERFWSIFVSFAWPLGLIALGIYLLWVAKSGKFKKISFDSSKPLRPNQNDKRIFGVCGGLAEYFHIDPTVVRVLAIFFLIVSTWITLIIYIVAAILMSRN